MAQLSVNIGGRAYRLACNPGEESHLEALAATLDRKIAEMRTAFGEIGDQRLTVMAALTMADEAGELRRTVEAARRASADTLEREQEARRAAETRAEALAQAMQDLSLRVEGLAASLAGAAGG